MSKTIILAAILSLGFALTTEEVHAWSKDEYKKVEKTLLEIYKISSPEDLTTGLIQKKTPPKYEGI